MFGRHRIRTFFIIVDLIRRFASLYILDNRTNKNLKRPKAFLIFIIVILINRIWDIIKEL